MPNKIDELFQEATAYQEDTGEGDFKSFINVDKASIDENPPQAQEKRGQPKLQTEPIQQTVQQPEAVQPKPAEQIGSIYEAVKEQQENDQANEYNNSVDAIGRIITISNKYCNYDSKVQACIKRFVGVEKDEDDLPSIVSAVLKADKANKVGLHDIVSIKAEERQERVFSLFQMDDNRLLTLKELVVLFTEDFYLKEDLSNRTALCREIEIGIERLNPENLNYLKPMSELLDI